MKEKVRVYTRDINKDDFPFGLAKAVHFEVENEDDKGVRSTTALNNNYAVLFAEGNISKDNTIIPLGIDDPVKTSHLDVPASPIGKFWGVN